MTTPSTPSKLSTEDEDDIGYGPSHGYGPGHGGPSGPGDVPAGAKKPVRSPPRPSERTLEDEENARPSETEPNVP